MEAGDLLWWPIKKEEEGEEEVGGMPGHCSWKSNLGNDCICQHYLTAMMESRALHCAQLWSRTLKIYSVLERLHQSGNYCFLCSVKFKFHGCFLMNMLLSVQGCRYARIDNGLGIELRQTGHLLLSPTLCNTLHFIATQTIQFMKQHCLLKCQKSQQRAKNLHFTPLSARRLGWVQVYAAADVFSRCIHVNAGGKSGKKNGKTAPKLPSLHWSGKPD